jgi:hypothetical protein
MRRILPLLLALPLALALVVARPAPAYACMWTVPLPPLAVPTPFPPCDQRDEAEIQRLKNANVKVGQKLATTVAKIREVKREIRAWQSATETARGFEDQLRAVYGDLSTDPMPSLVSAYRRTNMAQYVGLEVGEDGQLQARMRDFRATGDSILDSYKDTDRLKARYDYFLDREEVRWTNQFTRVGAILDNRLQSLGNWEAQVRPHVDSVSAAGNRIANRYQGRDDVDGLSESKITTLSAELNRLRGTAFETQALGVRARMGALDEAIRMREQLTTDQAIHSGLRF